MYVSVTRKKLFLFFLFCIVLFSPVNAQVSEIITSVKHVDAKEGEDLSVSAELTQSLSFQTITLCYKKMNSSDFKEVEMVISGRTLEAIIPGEDIEAPFLEFYIKVDLSNGTALTYPINAPNDNAPARIVVQPKSPKDKEVIILSPEKNKSVPESEFFVSVSLLRASVSVNKSATKIFIDGIDITGSILFAEDMLLFSGDNSPQKFGKGRHDVKVVLYDYTNTEYYSTSTSFTIITDEDAEADLQKFTYTGNAVAESRNENISSKNTWYNNIAIDLNGVYKDWEINLESYISSEEKSYLQRINRYKMEVKSSYVEFAAGDHSPKYPNLVMSGKRVLGFTGNVKLGYFNIQTTVGEINRAVEGTFDSLYNYNPNGKLVSNSIAIDPAVWQFNRARIAKSGVFKRDLFVIRPSFGKGEKFQLGFTYLHSKDDIKSVVFSSKPKENLVVGTDLFLGFWDQRILITGQAAMSLQNSDISLGDYTDAELDTFLVSSGLSRDDIDTWIKLKSKLSKFMTVNGNIAPLNPDELPTLAAEAAMTLNLNQYGNYLKTSYIYRGGDYQSFGNSFVRTNVKGINISDRQRLFENSLFISAGFELLSDNLQKLSVYTTDYRTITSSISYYPRFDFPSLLVSFTNNAILDDRVSTDSSKTDVAMNRIMLQASYDFVLYKKHQLQFGYTNSIKDDRNTFKNYDAVSSNVSIGTSTVWSDVFLTNLNIIVNKSEVNVSQNNIQTLDYVSLDFGGKLYMMNNDLLLYGSITPSFGDFKRFGYEGHAQYKVLQNFYVEGQLRFYMNSQIASISNIKNNDYVIGLSTRYSW